MEKRILILSFPTDIHAVAVAAALEKKGARPVVWFTSDFPSRSGESILFERGPEPRIQIQPALDLGGLGFDTVWYRRPLTLPDEALLHPADIAFAQQQCDGFRRSLYRLLCPGAFWVNRPDPSSESSQKILQQSVALACALEMPPTLYSNDPAQIRAFLAAQGGEAVFKPLRAVTWLDDQTRWVPYATVVTAETLIEDELLRQTPSIYQALVPKAYELRVTIMGRQAFAAKVLSQDTETGKLDWRRSYRELRMEPTELPAPVLERCFELMDRLSIVFGCFDFIVTPDGRHVFLEVNEAGQFLFIEEYTGMPLLEAFCDFLIAGRKDFRWSGEASGLSFAEIQPLAEQRIAEAAKEHIIPPLQGFYEGESPAAGQPA
jgi:glutathione synthase/RimK-type ligase-like ATP-grasp enzyme